MNRRIISTSLQTSGAGGAVDTYFDRVIKLIPGDVVAAWTVVASMITKSEGGVESPNTTPTVYWIVFGVFVVLTAGWTYKQTAMPNVGPNIKQICLATMAFVVWVFALGGPFAMLEWYTPLYGSLALIIYTVAAPIFVNE